MSENQRDELKNKEQRNNPGGALNNTWAQAHTGSPGRGCLVNIASLAIVIVILLIVRACTN